MNIQLKFIACLTAWTCCLAPILLSSADAAEHEALLPYLTDDVAAVAYIDVSSMDLPAIATEARELGVADALIDQAAAGIAVAQQAYDRLSELGARRAYVLVRSTDLADQGFPWVLEVADDGRPDAIADMLAEIFGANGETESRSGVWFAPRRIQAHAGVVLAAMNDDQMKRLQDGTTSTPREAAIEALAALGDADEGVVVIGDADSRRVLREMFPQLPAPFTEIDGRLIADGLLWGGVKIKHPPQPHATVIIESAGAEVAQTVQQSIAKAIELAKAFALASLAGGGGADLPVEPVRLVQGLALLNPTVEGRRLTLTLGDDDDELAFLHDLLAPAVGAARQSAIRNQRMNQFKQIALAMHNYASANTTRTDDGKRSPFPSHANYDEEGRALLSWRVHLLPYLDQQALYDQFHLDEPWDSEHNLPLANTIPSVYLDIDPLIQKAIGPGRTTYVVPYGGETVFHGTNGTAYSDIRDGTVHTILCVEVIPERAVVWSKPDDWEVNLDQPLNGVRRTDRETFAAAFCDGSVHSIASDIDSDAFRAMLTKAGED